MKRIVFMILLAAAACQGGDLKTRIDAFSQACTVGVIAEPVEPAAPMELIAMSMSLPAEPSTMDPNEPGELEQLTIEMMEIIDQVKQQGGSDCLVTVVMQYLFNDLIEAYKRLNE